MTSHPVPPPLFWKNSLAGAVAREIRNNALEARPLEGLAYKAEWDRRGSAAGKHVSAMIADRAVPARVPRDPR